MTPNLFHYLIRHEANRSAISHVLIFSSLERYSGIILIYSLINTQAHKRASSLFHFIHVQPRLYMTHSSCSEMLGL